MSPKKCLHVRIITNRAFFTLKFLLLASFVCRLFTKFIPFFCAENFAHLFDIFEHFRFIPNSEYESDVGIQAICVLLATKYYRHRHRRCRCCCCCECQNDNKRSWIAKPCECQGSYRIQQFLAAA